jgi:L,D-peptidoglycan transpeptidase YkuD (ErfK/YbiS/YcfS/YnhG family)
MQHRFKNIGLTLLLSLPFSTVFSADLLVSVESSKHKDIVAHSPSVAVATFKGKHYACFIGRCGATKDKVEGDRKTPVGSFPLRCVYYRPDKFSQGVVTGLPQKPLKPNFACCDDPTSSTYNQLVTLPFSASHEVLWRSDDLYDLVIIVGYNDQPVRKGRGSAVFIHLANKNTVATAGCVAFSKKDLLEILRGLDQGSRLVVTVC